MIYFGLTFSEVLIPAHLGSPILMKLKNRFISYAWIMLLEGDRWIGYSLSEVTTNFINCGLRNDLLATVGLVPLSFGHSDDKTESFSFGYSDGSGQFSVNCYCIFGVSVSS